MSRINVGPSVTKFEAYYNVELEAMVFLAGAVVNNKEYNLLLHDDGTISSVITDK